MATFHPNPNEAAEPWIEKSALDGSGFRNWHLILISFSGFLTLVILVCCCVKIRIPRTKQEIEANYRRKKLVEKFRARIRLIRNQEMDEMDLKRGNTSCTFDSIIFIIQCLALEIIQEDYKTESKRIDDLCDLTKNPKRPQSKIRTLQRLITFTKHRNNNQLDNQC
ncbi:PREDICTED: transmembrane inner ear expressed protein isoform X2 [Nicrophorus vespilloides]|uniref:Transmembrane inner ear expressed protein isoform X2 n=1 Tax=Nicrophorus vespilloides TaxID=110193 RepID=A0ABM1NDZ8_NICVS|nr:PREDICTED: transmembrane inner ear expressed protein isoform X2 [Nicrophorus vespilloides]